MNRNRKIYYGYDDTHIANSVTNRLSRTGIAMEVDIANSDSRPVVVLFGLRRRDLPISPFGTQAPDTDEEEKDDKRE